MWTTALAIAPPLIQAISVAVTAVFAILSLNAWKRQMIGKRRIEVAEEALLAVYKAKSAMGFIRNSMSFGGEGAGRPRGNSETEAIAQAKDTYFVQLKRIQDTSGDFAELEKMRLLCQVHFGRRPKPFDAIPKARHTVAVSSRLLVDLAGETGEQAFRERLKADVWEGYGSNGKAEEDAIVKSVAAAVADVEGICRRHLKL
jgi:hypothetical protein